MKKIGAFLGMLLLSIPMITKANWYRVNAHVATPGKVKLGRSLGTGTIDNIPSTDQAISTINPNSKEEEATLSCVNTQGTREFDGRTGLFDIMAEFSLEDQLTRIHVLFDPRKREYNVINEENKSLTGGWNSLWWGSPSHRLTKPTGKPGKTALMIIGVVLEGSGPIITGSFINIVYGIKEMWPFVQSTEGLRDVSRPVVGN